MSSHEQKVSDTERHYDEMMKEIEQVDPNILYMLVPGSQLHQKINNPLMQGVDKE